MIFLTFYFLLGLLIGKIRVVVMLYFVNFLFMRGLVSWYGGKAPPVGF